MKAVIYQATLFLDENQTRYLTSCAKIRHISRHKLVERIMNTVCKDQLVLSILDDYSETKAFPDEKYPYKSEQIT